ncbi:unnamed protein product [Musa banksii]
MHEVAVGNYRAFIAAADTVSFIKEQLSGFDKHLDSLVLLTHPLVNPPYILMRFMNLRMVNCHRMHLFDVVNQYRAIFNHDKSGSEENYDGTLLFSWAMHQIKSHLSAIEAMLPKITEVLTTFLRALLCCNVLKKHCISNFNILFLRSFRDSYCFSASVLDFLLIGTHRHSKPWFMLLHSNLYIFLLGFLCLMLYDVFLFHVLYNFSLPDSSISCTYGNLISILQSSIRYLLSPCRIICFSYCAMGLGLVGFDFRGLLPSLFESAVINLFSKNMSIAVENFQIVLDLHRWVPLPSVGFVTN